MSRAGIELDDVVVELRRRRILDGCTATLGPGVTALLGANGAGKSTLLRATVGLLPIASGAAHVGGDVVSGAGLNRRQGALVGYLPQDPRLPERLTVRESMQYATWLRGVAMPDRHATDLLDELGIARACDRRLGELSGGTNRLAMVAVATAHRPSVLLLDEATAGVDAEHRGRLRTFLRDRRATTTIVLSTHVLDDVEHLADRVLVLAGGRIAADTDPTGLAAMGASRRRDGESIVEAALRHVGSVDDQREASPA